MARAYDVLEVEKKWQQRWADEGTYEVDADDPRPPWYVLSMYPYPSGPAHMGHVRNYTFGDLLVRHRTMLGYAVLSPFGFDSFGLPAENAAIQTGTHPRIFTEARIAELKESITSLGAVYDWRREIRSHDPEYIKWNQVIFRGSWPPAWPTGPRPRSTGARDARRCWPTSRCWPTGPASVPGDVVEKRDLEQWFFRITDYADELLADLDDLEWPERVKTMQRNWIGRSEGAEFDLPVEGRDGSDGRPPLALRVFTTRPGHLVRHDLRRGRPRAPPGRRADHPRAPGRGRGAADPGRGQHRRRAHVRERAQQPGQARRLHRLVGASIPSPARPVPVYVADYVLMGYGTGAIMAVPAEDARDWDFAQAYGLPVVRTVQPARRLGRRRWPGRGLHRARARRSTASGSNGLDIPTAKAKATEWLEAEGTGARKVNYRLRDWLVSRQRFWGCPIPVVYCPDHGIVPVPGRPAAGPRPRRRRVPPHGPVATGHPRRVPPHHLPDLRRPGHPRDRHHGHLRRLVVVLPALHRSVDPGGCPSTRRWPVTGCRSTSTSAGSSTPSSTCSTPASSPRRWPTSGLAPAGLREPFTRYYAQGMIRMDGTKMSKSRGNLVAPSSYSRPSGPTPCASSTSSSGHRPTTWTGPTRPTA